MERRSRVRASVDHNDPSFVHFLLILLEEPVEKIADSLSRANFWLYMQVLMSNHSSESQVYSRLLTPPCGFRGSLPRYNHFSVGYDEAASWIWLDNNEINANQLKNFVSMLPLNIKIYVSIPGVQHNQFKPRRLSYHVYDFYMYINFSSSYSFPHSCSCFAFLRYLSLQLMVASNVSDNPVFNFKYSQHIFLCTIICAQIISLHCETLLWSRLRNNIIANISQSWSPLLSVRSWLWPVETVPESFFFRPVETRNGRMRQQVAAEPH